MLKKIILCGSILLAFGDADSMRSSQHCRNPFAVRILGNGAGATIVFRFMNGACQDLQCFSKRRDSNHSAGEKQTVLCIGNRWREQHLGVCIPWARLLGGTGINPVWASRYYHDKEIRGALFLTGTDNPVRASRYYPDRKRRVALGIRFTVDPVDLVVEDVWGSYSDPGDQDDGWGGQFTWD
jgi:hypothetical protein